MSDTVLIYGHSDDLINVVGSLEDELTLPLDDEATIKFDTNATIEASYDGEWHFNPVRLSTTRDRAEVTDVGELSYCTNPYTEVCIFHSRDPLEEVWIRDE